MQRHWMIGVVVLLATRAVLAQEVVKNTRLPDAIPGQTIMIPVTGLTVKDSARAVLIDEGGTGRAVYASKVDDKAVNVTAPPDLIPGRYIVRLDARGKSLDIPGELLVKPLQPRIIAIAPEETAYSPTFLRSRFQFRVVGENFVKDHTYLVTRGGDLLAGPLADCAQQNSITAAPTEPAGKKAPKKPCLEHDPDDPTHVLHVYHFPRYRDYTGEIQVGVRVGNVQSADTRRLVLSRIPKGWIFFTAVILWLLLAVVLAATVSKVRGRRTDGRRYGFLPAFVLDKETNTYSLSKLQLLLWSAVGVFGYIYLFLCKLLVQWGSDFPDVPEGLPLLLGISGGTTVVAAAVQGNRGAKGSGPVHPSWADFISSGGAVVAERFQFFIWTIVGILGFVGLLLAADPAAFSTLPKIPDQFLGLMGISSLAYLGGKAVRKPGPVVQTATLRKTESSFTILIDGMNLEKTARLRLNGAPEPFTPDTVASVSQGDNANPNWSSQLAVTIRSDSNEGKALTTGTQAHTIEVINLDGQSGSATFVANPPALTSAVPLTAKAETQKLTVKGVNLVDGMTAEWMAPGKTAPDAIAAVMLVSSAEATVDVIAAKRGTGKITLIPPMGGAVSTTVEVN